MSPFSLIDSIGFLVVFAMFVKVYETVLGSRADRTKSTTEVQNYPHIITHVLFI